MNHNEIKNGFKNTFNEASAGYDLPELSFFLRSADFLVNSMNLEGGENILDVCTGTGHVAFFASKQIKAGTVTGIDISEKMIDAAKEKAEKFKDSKINFVCSDIDSFKSSKLFDIITCAFGIFFFPDMNESLQKMKSLLNKNGRIILSTFNAPFMAPQRNMFMEKLETYNIPVRNTLWSDIDTQEKFLRFLEKNEFKRIELFMNDCGYYLENEQQWWNVITYTNMRGSLTGLTENDLLKFKKEHLEEVAALNKDGKGIYLDVKVLYAILDV